jgi:hypothetical protein
MAALRWIMIGLLLACVFCVGWHARWMTMLSAPGQDLGVVHSESAPLWSPPRAKTLPEVLRTLDRSSEWHRIDAAQVTGRIEALWEPMLGDLLLLLVLATLLPGWLYTRVRGRDRDLVLHLGLRSGCGLALGLVASIVLWLVFGGWGAAHVSGPWASGSRAGAGDRRRLVW